MDREVDDRFNEKMQEMQDKYWYCFTADNKLKPWLEALKVIAVYILMGGLWISLSDKALMLLVQDIETVIKLQTYKGWFYVIITAIVLYIIIRSRIILFNKANKEILQAYEELSSTHEELIAMEEELYQQYNELKKNRDALSESNQRYQLVVEGANDGIWDWDLKANTDFFSITSKDVFGYEDDEVDSTYESWQKLIHPEDREKSVEKIESYLMSGKGSYKNTYRLKSKNGEYRWILSRAQGLWDEDGTPLRVAGSHTDITELMELQELLHKEKTLSQIIINGAPMIIAGEDTNGNIIEFNPFTESLTGYNKDEVLGKSWIDTFIPKGKIEYTRQVVTDTLSGKNTRNNENQIVTKQGEVIDILWNNNPFYDKNGSIVGIISTGIDITERKKMEDKLYSLAYYDTLTGLPNRLFFEKELINIIKKSMKNNTKFMLAYIDLDNFKNVNDTMGHTYGDVLIKEISEKLRNTLKGDITIARLGGDEFGIILPMQHGILESNAKILEIMDVINKSWVIEGNELYITCSLGVAIYPEDGINVSSLLKNADTAMYVAKDSGRNRYAFYTPQMNEKALNYMEMEKDLRNALVKNEFLLHYQPIIDLYTNTIGAVEGLIRWIHPVKGLVPPADFIPFAEESGLILEIGEQVIAMACEQLKVWKAEGKESFKLSINLSARQLMQHDIVDRINFHINEKNIDSSNLVLEITENAALACFDQSVSTLNKLKGMGIQIALDDFGTGYSSLNYLKQLPVDIIKMDKSFIYDICRDEESLIVKTVIDLAHNLKLSVTAEGIETAEQLNILNDYGCDRGQGYYYSRPVPAEELEVLLNRQRTRQ